MSEKLSITLESRTIFGKKVARLRRAGVLPGTVYGKTQEPLAVQVDARLFADTYRKAGRTALVELSVGDRAPIAAFVHTLQRHPVTRAIIHVDFLAVDLKAEVTVAVPIHIVGESPLVAMGDAILNQQLTALDIRALPAELPQAITIDVSGLDSFEKSIHARDIALPEGAHLATNPDELVIGLSVSRTAAAEEDEVAETAAAEPELVREKDEDEE
jgi:large subunit ribosomal protein L25